MAVPEDFVLLPLQSAAVVHLSGKTDGWLDEEHTLSLDVTSHPVESGAEITDNAVKRPNELKLTGFVSNLLSSDGGNAPASQRVSEAWEAIEAVMARRELTEIFTAIRHYQNMILMNSTTRRDLRVGHGLLFELSFREVLRFGVQAGRFTSGNTSGPARDRDSQADEGTIQSVTGPLGGV